jgi:hypothetical protein
MGALRKATAIRGDEEIAPIHRGRKRHSETPIQPRKIETGMDDHPGLSLGGNWVTPLIWQAQLNLGRAADR